MGDTRRFTRYGNRYELVGLDGRADDVAAAAKTVGAKIERRIFAARSALATWSGPHAGTFAEHLNAIVRRMGDFQSALNDRANYLSWFPAEPMVSTYFATSRVEAVDLRGTVGAETFRLRNVVNLSAGEARALRPLPERVTTDGVTGTSESDRPLTPAERQRYLDAGWSVAEIAAQRITETRELTPGQITELVHVSPVDGHVEPILAAAGQLDAFVVTVAAAIDNADSGLLTVLGADPGGADLGSFTATTIASHLLDPALSYEEAVATVTTLGQLGQQWPGIEAQIVVAMGATGVEDFQTRLNEFAFLDVDSATVVDELLTPWSSIVANATAPGGLVDADLEQLLAVLSPSTKAALIATAPFDERFLGPVVDEIADQADFMIADHSPLAVAAYHGDVFVAMAMGLNLNPVYAARALGEDTELLSFIATGSFLDDGMAAGALFSNVFYERVLADLAKDPTMAESLEASEAALAALVADDGFNEGSAIALAQIATLHFDAIAFTAETGENDLDGLPGVTEAQLADFYAELFESEAAQLATAQGLGAFATFQFESAAAEAEVSAANVWKNFNDQALSIGELKKLFAEAYGLEHAEDLEKHEFWSGVAEAVGVGVTRGGIAAAGLTGGWAAVAGVPTALAVGGLVRLVGKPSWDANAEAAKTNRIFQAAAVQVLATDEDLFNHALAEAGETVDPTAMEQLADPKLLEAIVRGDEAACERFDSLLKQCGIKDEVLEMATFAVLA